MRQIVALSALLLLAFPLISIVDQTVPSVSADSFVKWNKIFFLHDGERLSAGSYDWLNTSGPVNPAITDYDSDGVEGITFEKNVPPQRYHAWHRFPTVSSPMHLSESLSAHLWVWSQGNESGSIVKRLGMRWRMDTRSIFTGNT